MQVAERRGGAFTLYKGPKILYKNVEMEYLVWKNQLRDDDIPISSNQVICKAVSMESNYHNGKTKALWKWVYQYLRRNRLYSRRIAHEGQKLSDHLQTVKDQFTNMVNSRFELEGTMEGSAAKYVANMDETAVFLECKSKTTIYHRGANTIAARCSGSNSARMTVCVICCADGTKLPLFVVFKGKPKGHIEKTYNSFYPKICSDVVKMMVGWMNVVAAFGWKSCGSPTP